MEGFFLSYCRLLALHGFLSLLTFFIVLVNVFFLKLLLTEENLDFG